MTAVKPPGARKRAGRPPIEIDIDVVRQTAGRLFADHGYDSVTLERLASELGVSRSTLYRTISSKRELISVLLEELIEELGEQAEIVAAGARWSPSDRVLALVRLHISAAVRMRNYFVVWFHPEVQTPATRRRFRAFVRRYDDIWQRAITEAVDAGELPPLDARIATNLLIGMSNWVSKWYQPGGAATEDDIVTAAMAILGFPGRWPDLGDWRRPDGWIARAPDGASPHGRGRR